MLSTLAGFAHKRSTSPSQGLSTFVFFSSFPADGHKTHPPLPLLQWSSGFSLQQSPGTPVPWVTLFASGIVSFVFIHFFDFYFLPWVISLWEGKAFV